MTLCEILFAEFKFTGWEPIKKIDSFYVDIGNIYGQERKKGH